MPGHIDLPTTSKDRVRAINQALIPSMRTRNIHSIEWWIIHFYLLGARRFQILSWDRGTVKVSFENDEGEIDFRWEELLSQYQTELGRLLKMDVNPATAYDGLSLDALRKAGVGQAVLNAKVAPIDIDTFETRHFEMLLKFGMVGGAQWEIEGTEETEDGPRPKFAYEFENVPPWQLLSIPDSPQTLEDLQIITRQRQTTLEYLKKQRRYAGKISGASDEDLKARQVPIGQNPVTGPGQAGSASAVYGLEDPMSMRAADQQKGKKGRTTETVVLLNESWVLGPSGTCLELIESVGNVELGHTEYPDPTSDKRRLMPLGISRYTPTDSFYGRGFLSRIIGLNDQVEKMLKNLFENVQDMDEFGWLMIPDNLGLNKRSFKKTSKPRLAFFSADYTNPQSKPFNLGPATTGDFPGRIASMAADSQRRISNQGEILQGEAPGRTESGAALGLLYETNAIPLTVPAGEVRRTFKQLYRSLLQSCKRNYESTGGAIQLTTVDDTIAGVVVDPLTGVMQLDKNPIPHPWEIKIDIRDVLPRPVEQQKQELLQMLQMQLITPMEFRIINYREQLGFPVGNRAEWEGYQKAVFQNIVLFGDGKTPGKVVGSSAADNPIVHLFALSDFMAKIQFSLASDDVREQFEARLAFYESEKGKFPEEMPRPEDMEAMQAGGM